MGGGTLRDGIRPVSKETLADRLARQIRSLIQRGEYRLGDRLPTMLSLDSDETGIPADVELVPLTGARVVPGLRGETGGALDA